MKCHYQLLNMRRNPPRSARYALQSLGHVCSLPVEILSGLAELMETSLTKTLHSLVEPILEQAFESLFEGKWRTRDGFRFVTVTRRARTPLYLTIEDLIDRKRKNALQTILQPSP